MPSEGPSCCGARASAGGFAWIATGMLGTRVMEAEGLEIFKMSGTIETALWSVSSKGAGVAADVSIGSGAGGLEPDAGRVAWVGLYPDAAGADTAGASRGPGAAGRSPAAG